MTWKPSYTLFVAGIICMSALTLFAVRQRQSDMYRQPIMRRRVEYIPVQEAVPPMPSQVPLPAESTTTVDEYAQVHRLPHDPIPLPGERAVRVPILMYHYIREFSPKFSPEGDLLTVTPEDFDKQMQEIVDNGFQTISPDDLYLALTAGAPLPKHPVMITFDDGYRDQYTAGYPSLMKHGLCATFFIITSYLHYSGYMSAAMLKDMDASGMMTIASHTRHHAPLTKVATSTAMDEIDGSKQDLEAVLGHPVEDFAYPYGYANTTIEKMTQDAGYRLGFSTLFGSLHTSSSDMELRRIRVRDGEDLGPLLKKYGQ